MGSQRLTLFVESKVQGEDQIRRLKEELAQLKKESASKAENPFAAFPREIESTLQNPLSAAQSALSGFASSFGVAGAAAVGFVGTLTALQAGSMEAARSLGEFGNETRDLSLMLGMSTKEIGQFSFAARMSGNDISVFEGAMRKLSQGLAAGGEDGKKTADALRDLGVRTVALNGDVRPMAEIFTQIAAGLEHFGSAAERNAKVIDLFGKSGITLIPVLDQLREKLDLAKANGIGADDATIKRFERYQEQIALVDTLWSKVSRKLKDGIAAEIAISVSGAGARLMLDFLGDRSIPGYTPLPVHSSSTGTTMDYLLGAAGRISSDAESRASGDLIVQQYRSRRLSTPDGLAEEIRDLEAKNANLRTKMVPGSGIGDQAARDTAAQLDANQRTIDRLKDQQKEAEKLLAHQRELAEKSAQLAREGRTAYRIGTGLEAQLVEPFLDPMAGRSIGPPSLYGRRGAPQAPRYDNFGNFTGVGPETPTGEYLGSGIYLPPEITAQSYPLQRYDALGAMLDLSRREGTEGQRIRMASMRSSADLSASLISLRTLPGGELDAARQIAEIRTRAANEEFAVTRDTVQQWSDKLAIAKDYQLAVAQAAQRQREGFASFAGGFFDASMNGGVSQFFRGELMRMGRTATENFARSEFESLRTILPHAKDPNSMMGKLLADTPFGADPLKEAGTTLLSAGLKLDLSAQKLLSVSSPGGGVVPLPTSVYDGVTSGSPTIFSLLRGVFKKGVNPPATAAFGSLGTDLYDNEIPDIGATSLAVLGKGGSKGLGLAKGAGIAAAAATGGLAAFQDFRRGGAGGVMEGVGALAGMGGSIAMMAGATGPAAPIVAGIGMALSMLGGLFNSKAKRQSEMDRELAAAQFQMPMSLSITQDLAGNYVDEDARGNIRTSGFRAAPVVSQPYLWWKDGNALQVPGRETSPYTPPPVQNNYYGPVVQGDVKAIDALSFREVLQRNAPEVLDAATTALQAGGASVRFRTELANG